MEKIRVFVIDPAWRQRKGGLRKSRGNQGRELDYVTMEVPEIFGLLDREIFPLAEDDHCVFMWTIDRFLLECENEMEKRGYKRHCRMIWNKLNGVARVYRPVFTRVSDMVLPEEAAAHSRGTAGKVHDRICRTEQAAQPETGFLLPHDRCLVSLLWENGCVFTGTQARLAAIRKPDGLFQLILPLNPK